MRCILLMIFRFGYQTAFLERQIVLRIMFERLNDKSKIFLNSRVLKVDHSEKNVIVHCDNGDSYTGNIVVAADGVNSFIRSEMRRYADLQSSSIMDKDRQSRYTITFLSDFADCFCLRSLGRIHVPFRHSDTSTWRRSRLPPPSLQQRFLLHDDWRHGC